MYFPAADIQCHPLLPFAAAALIAFFTSMGGVSGAVVLLPFQMSVLGYTGPGVSATNQIFNILACPAGVWRYWKEGRLLWPLAVIIASGTLPGVFLGAFVRLRWLPDASRFKLFAAAVLLFVGGRMLLASRKKRGGMKGRPDGGAGTLRILRFDRRAVTFRFMEQEHAVAVWPLALLSLAVGLVGGIYGIGGGAIIAPFLVSFFEIPVYVLAGATLMATAFTSCSGVLFYSLLASSFPGANAAPDWRLGLLIGMGGMLGMYFGARLQKHVPERFLRILLACILLGTALRYACG
jgi:uncharacterized membrane protein YfcA